MLVIYNPEIIYFHFYIPFHFNQLIAQLIKIKNPNNNTFFATIITLQKVCKVIKCIYYFLLQF